MNDPISLGEYTDHVLRLNHKRKGNKGLTEYVVNEISKNADISQRQIDRVRNYSGQEFPEGDAINKLASVLPEIKNIRPKDLCNRLLAPWDLVEEDQKTMAQESLEHKHKLHIVSGWELPQALQDEDICLSVVDNLDQGLEYEFIFPPISSYPYSSNNIEDSTGDGAIEIRQWLKMLRRSLDIKWYSRQRFDDDCDLEKSHKEFKDKINASITFRYTEKQSKFWSILPSPYTALYNLGKNITTDRKFGMFLVKDGSPIRYKEGDNELVSSEGWLYICREKYDLIDREYRQLEEKNELKSIEDLQ
jgi:hypothetical protein